MPRLSQTDLFTEPPAFPNITPFSTLQSSDNANAVSPSTSATSTFDKVISGFSVDDKPISDPERSDGGLTGTEMNLNLLQGSIFSFGNTDTIKNPVRPFSSQKDGMRDREPVSYKEGLSNDVSSNTVSTITYGTTSAGKSQKLLDLEKELSELTTKYTTQYRLYTDDLLTRSQFIQTNSKYLNKIVRDISYSGTDASAAFYYINSFGYTHRYKDASAVTLNDSSCPKLDRSITDVELTSGNPFQLRNLSDSNIFVDISGSGSAGFSRFSDYASYDMAASPCIVTKNVKTILTNGNAEYAWVDVEGKKHIYEKGVWPDKRSATCSSANVGEPIDLTLDRYNAIPTATDAPMKETSECFKSSVSPSINTQLVDLKKKIDDVVAAIKVENQNITNSVANTTIIKREKTVAEKLSELDNTILAQIKTWLGNYYYPAVYIFWCLVILFALLMIFKFAFFFITPSGDVNGNGDSGGGVSIFGVIILALIVISAVYYYFIYTYNLDVRVTRNDAVYTVQ